MPNTQIAPATPFTLPARGHMRQRQRPLMRLYQKEPEAAHIVDGARSLTVESEHDPVHGMLSVGTAAPWVAPLSIHAAVGGDHDGPNPGDYLAAALVGCFSSTMRIIADRLDITLESLDVEVGAHVDVRGTLCVDPDVPVGFEKMVLRVDARPAEGTPDEAMDMLFAATEHCCVVLQTLKHGVRVDGPHR